MKSIAAALKPLVFVLMVLAAALLGSDGAFADKLFLKDGRVLTGRVKMQDAGIVIFVEVTGGKEGEVQYLSADDVLRTVIENPPPETATPLPPAAPLQVKASGKPLARPETGAAITGRPLRVAVLNFGAPRSWQDEIGRMVGQEIASDAWKRAIPMLERDKVDVVVVRINSGGGYLFELAKFHEVFAQYKPRFRTVAWVESAISCAAMSPWVLEEFYMLPEGNIGACTGWGGQLVEITGPEREKVLRDMEEASRKAGRDPRIMRSMQIMEPLSYNRDENGRVTWFQDLTGSVIANPVKQILTFTADEAIKSNFAHGKAATLDELVKAMGIAEYEIAGKEATRFIDDNMRQNDRAAKDLRQLEAKYDMAFEAARTLRGPENKDRRMAEIGVARATLKLMKQWMSGNPNFYMTTRNTHAWFAEQERLLKELAKD